MNKSKELHIFVIWHNALYLKDKIINDIKENLQILEVFDIEWTKEKIPSNFSRLYNFTIPFAEGKMRRCGDGNFILITAMDNNPDYQFTRTLRGFETVNCNPLNLKYKYREWLEGKNLIHSSVRPEETKHDLCLLLGISYDDYLKTTPKNWNGEIKSIKQDLAGCNGWKSLNELFYVLNETSNYAVLRNYEILPDNFKSDLHGDIDIITDDYENICYKLNATPDKPDWSGMSNIVNGITVYWDIRRFGDDYYCRNFEKDMLKQRVLNQKGIYTLCDEHYFYSLIYHALIQKRYVASDYTKILYGLFVKLGLNEKYDINSYIDPYDLYFILLKNYLKNNGYKIIKSKQALYNETVLYLDETIDLLEKSYPINNVKSCKISEHSWYNYKFFHGYYEDKHLFIKSGGIGYLCDNEFTILEALYNRNQINFPKPYWYTCYKDTQNIVTEYIEGKSLKYYIDNNLLTEEMKKSVVKDLEDILKTLSEEKIMHRNIVPTNLIMSDNGHFKLIDFRYAVYFNNYKEDNAVKENLILLESLDTRITDKKYEWNDVESVSKILKSISEKSKYIEENINKNKLTMLLCENNKIKPATFLQKIFSVRNEVYITKTKTTVLQKKYKVIRVLGFKIKVKRRK